MRNRPSYLRSLTRLAIGATLFGLEELAKRLPEWDPPTTIELSEQKDAHGDSHFGAPTSNSELQDGMIGLAFDLQDQVQANLDRLDDLTRWASKRTSGFMRPFTQSRVGKLVASRVDGLAERGQRQVDRWVSIGQYESSRSKMVFHSAYGDSVESVVSDLSVNPEIQQLIQSQSVTLAGEMVDEVRERSVSADNYLELFTRSMLKRPSRGKPPEPPEEVRRQAEPFRRFRGRTIRK